MLLGCGLVRTKQMGDGNVTVMSSVAAWEDFLMRYHLDKDGDVKFRFLAKTIIKTVTGQYYVDVYSLADVACKKDNAIILNATVMGPMVEGMNDIAFGKLIFGKTLHEEGGITVGEYNVDLVQLVNQNASTGMVVNPKSYLTGDLAFLTVVLGKEGFEGWWCNFCKGYRTNWQTKGALFEPWSMAELINQAV